MKHLILFLCLSAPLFAHAQQKDVVYLKNGSIIKGNVLEAVQNGTIKIETRDGSLFVFNMDDVIKIEKENITTNASANHEADERGRRSKSYLQPKAIFPTPKGYFVLAKLGPIVRPFEGVDFSASFINGVHLMEYISVGVGIDVANITYDDDNFSTITVMPVYLDARFYIPKRRVNPMFHFQFGYGTVIDKSGGDQFPNGSLNIIPIEGKGGLFMAVGAGMRVLINQHISIVAEGGITSHGLKGYLPSNSSAPNSSNYRSESLESLRLNMGVCFSFGKEKKAE